MKMFYPGTEHSIIMIMSNAKEAIEVQSAVKGTVHVKKTCPKLRAE